MRQNDEAGRGWMGISRPTRRAVAGGMLAGAAMAALPRRLRAALVPANPPPPIRFEVIRAGERIGSHLVDFQPQQDGYAVRTRIEIAVRLLGVTVFVFRHDSTEVWAGDRLQRFDSKTKDDDSDFFVTGRATAEGFRITHRKGTEMGPPDIMVGSYWTPEIARRSLLIDPQRGRLKAQTILGQDRFTVTVRGKSVETDRYRLTGVTNGWVAYDERGHWLAAELQKKGSDILYRVAD